MAADDALFNQLIKLRDMYGHDSLGHLIAVILYNCIKHPDAGSYRPAMIAALENPDSLFFVQSTIIDGRPVETFKNFPSMGTSGRWAADKDWTCQVFSDNGFWQAKDADTKVMSRLEVLGIYNSLSSAAGQGPETENENDVENW